MIDIENALKMANNISLQGLKSGQEIGRREGLMKAAVLCEARAKLHAEYLPAGAYYTQGDHAQAATCGRRDEAAHLAYMIRDAIKEHDAEQLKPEPEKAA